MLADKLLNSFDFSTDKERQTLELLKVGIHDVGRPFWGCLVFLFFTCMVAAGTATHRCPMCQLCVYDKPYVM